MKAFKKLSVITLGLLMAGGLTAGIISEQHEIRETVAAEATKTWDLKSASAEWAATGNVSYFGQPYGYKAANGTLTNKSISDFSKNGITSIKVGFKCLQNGGTTSKITISLVDSTGTALAGGVVATPVNKSSADQTAYAYATFTTGLSNATGFMMKVTTFGKNILVNGAEYTVTYTDKVLSTISVSGTPTKTKYKVGEAFDPTGLVATANYTDGSSATITDNVVWSQATIADGQTSCDITATYNGVTSNNYTVTGLSTIKIQSIAISGDVTNKSYGVGDALNPAGLTVTATYTDGTTTEDVTSKVDWVSTPVTLSIGQTSCSVKAVLGSIESEAIEVTGLTVLNTSNVTLDLSTETFKSQSEDKVEWETTHFSLTSEKNNSTTAANNYIGGLAGRTSTRFYNGSKVTLEAYGDNKLITLMFTASESKYATAFTSSTFANATTSTDDLVVTLTVTDSSLPVVINPTGTCGFTSIEAVVENGEASIFEASFIKVGIAYPSEVPTGVEGTACLGADGNYAKAVAAYAELSNEAKTAFATNDDFANARARMSAWAAANGVTLTFGQAGELILGSPELTMAEQSGTATAIIASVVISMTAVGAFFFFKKKKVVKA